MVTCLCVGEVKKKEMLDLLARYRACGVNSNSTPYDLL